MVDTVIYLILVPMVYLAVLVFLIGIVYRAVGLLRDPKLDQPLHLYPEKKPAWLWGVMDAFLLPGVRKSHPVFWGVLLAFHFCFLLLILGHLELVREFEILQLVDHEVFVGGGYVGLILSIALLYFLFRRFLAPTRHLSVPEDYILLILLFLTVIFGSHMDWARRWYGYEEIGVDAYRTYLMSLVVFKPDIADVTMFGHSFMLVLHVFFANLFLMIFPFSKIMHSFFAIPLNMLRRGT